MRSGCQGSHRRSRHIKTFAFSILLPLLITTSGCVSKLVLHSTTSPPRPTTPTHRYIPGEQGKIEVFIRPPRKNPTCEPRYSFLEFGGNAGRADYGTSLPAAFLDHFCAETWSVNYPGFGSSQGEAKLRHIAPAARTAYDALGEHAKNRPIIAYGFSLGASPALHLSAHRPVRAVIVKNPAPVARMILTRYGWWNLWLAAMPVAAAVPWSLNTRRNASRSKAPALFLTAERDEVVRPFLQRRIYRAYDGPKHRIIMKNARHNDGISRETGQKMIDWFESQVAPN